MKTDNEFTIKKRGGFVVNKLCNFLGHPLTWLVSGFLVFVGVLLFFSAVVGVDPEAATKTLDSAGYSEIEIPEGHAWGACGSDDFSATRFIALNPVGKRVRGAVCCGMFFKNCTIRF